MNDHQSASAPQPADDVCSWEESVGPYVLGGLDDGERSRFEEHLRTCGTCRLELEDLAMLPALLDEVPVERAVDMAAVSAGAGASNEEDGQQLLRRLRTERTRRRRRRVATQFALAASLLVVGGVAVDQYDQHMSAPQRSVQAAGMPVRVGMSDKPWGTELSLEASNLPTRGKLSMWVVGPAGTPQNAATWLAAPTGSANLTAPVAMHMKDVNQIVIKDESGAAVATVPMQA